MASDLNLDYYYQKCKGDSLHTQSANLEVDIEVLNYNLKLLLT